MKKYMKVFFILYLAGFAAGSVCCSLLVRQTGYHTGLLGLYLAGGTGNSVESSLLFWHLLKKRGAWFFIFLIGGITPFGIPMTLGGLLWLGFLGGNLTSSFLLEYGLKGMLIEGACLFPQILFYIPAVVFLAFFVVQMSQKYWGKGMREKADYRAYLFFMTGVLILFLLGIFMESYVNCNVLGLMYEKFTKSS